jgi:hypothetical protein
LELAAKEAGVAVDVEDVPVAPEDPLAGAAEEDAVALLVEAAVSEAAAERADVAEVADEELLVSMADAAALVVVLDDDVVPLTPPSQAIGAWQKRYSPGHSNGSPGRHRVPLGQARVGTPGAAQMRTQRVLNDRSTNVQYG